MIQLIGLLVISWLLIWFFEKKNLTVLGIIPTKKRLTFFILLFIVSSLLSVTTYILKIYIAKEHYSINPVVSSKIVTLEIWHQFRTVLTEELLCRGALLYILIKKTGPKKAIFISSFIFALLHWINQGIWGNSTQMILVFIFTFIMGLLLAFSYARTFSLLIPFAIHLGWNWIQNYVFADTIAINPIFILSEPPPTVTISYLAFFTMLLLPKMAVLLFNYFIIKQYKQVEVP
jgi:uncharacterized protein